MESLVVSMQNSGNQTKMNILIQFLILNQMIFMDIEDTSNNQNVKKDIKSI